MAHLTNHLPACRPYSLHGEKNAFLKHTFPRRERAASLPAEVGASGPLCSFLACTENFIH